MSSIETTEQVTSVSNILDLGPGETVKDSYIIKHECNYVASGKIINNRGCLMYSNENLSFNISFTGELVKGNYCNQRIRINSTHTATPYEDGTLTIAPSGFPSLLEEEEMLKYPPKLVSIVSQINEILKNSSLLNKIEGMGLQKNITSSAPDSTKLDWLTSVLSSNIFKWVQLILIILAIAAFFVLFCYLILFLIKMIPKPTPPESPVMTITSELKDENREKPVGSGRKMHINL